MTYGKCDVGEAVGKHQGGQRDSGWGGGTRREEMEPEQGETLT